MIIPNDHYHDSAVFSAETVKVFQAGWQFVALEQELAVNRDFVRVDMPDDSIVVQNFQGELRAFQNICSHRLNLIQTTDRGNRPLMCGYHGWTFNSDGRPLGRREQQGFTDEESASPDRLCLIRYKVARCGKFIFVSRDPDGPSLEEFLGEFANLLREISRYLGKETHYRVVSHAANWKLLVDNVLECYHCATIHPDTFISGLGVGLKPIAEVRCTGLHSSSHFPRVPTRREALRRKIMSHLDQRAFAHESFFHIYIFPNLFISSTEGTAFYVGHALPLSATETKLRVRLFEPDVTLTDAGRIRQDAISVQGVALALQVIEEDRAILETTQQGLKFSDRPAVLGPEEVRNRLFHNAYCARMSDAGGAIRTAATQSAHPVEAA